MVYSLTWLPTVLGNAGLKVAQVPGWANRGHGNVGAIQGIICHHTAGPKTGNMPSLGVVTNGRPGLSGPLAQLCLARDGTYYVVAAGKCYHAGPGTWHGITTGNTSFIGIEAENTGLGNDQPWPVVQMDAYRHGVAAILKHIGHDASWCCGHKEYALPHGRKSDPPFDMKQFRTDVAAILGGGVAPLPPIPPTSPTGQPTLRRGSKGDEVKQLQQKLGVELTSDGHFGPLTEAAVRRFQRDKGLVPDGIVGPNTWAALG